MIICIIIIVLILSYILGNLYTLNQHNDLKKRTINMLCGLIECTIIFVLCIIFYYIFKLCIHEI